MIANLFLGRDGPRDWVKLSAIRVELIAENEHLRQENAGLEKQINRLRNDDAYLQGFIRSELGYIRPDEITYRFSTEPPHE